MYRVSFYISIKTCTFRNGAAFILQFALMEKGDAELVHLEIMINDFFLCNKLLYENKGY